MLKQTDAGKGPLLEVIAEVLSRLGPLQRKVLIACIAALAGLGVFVSFASSQDRAAVSSAIRDPLSILRSRSPGQRPKGALYQTKPRKAAITRARPPVIASRPKERVLAVVRRRPVPAPLIELPAFALPPDAGLTGFPVGVFDLPDLGNALSPPGFDVPPFAFGDRPRQTGSGTPTPPITPGGAVPEVATWLMMVMGIGMIGHTFRSRTSVINTPATGS